MQLAALRTILISTGVFIHPSTIGGNMKRPWRLVLQFVFLLLVFSLIAKLSELSGWAQANANAAKTDPPTWVEIGENGKIIARQIEEKQKVCPPIQVKGGSNPPTQMQQRGKPSTAFPVLVCEAVIPSDATSASIGEISLPLPKSAINKIVLVGDTG